LGIPDWLVAAAQGGALVSPVIAFPPPREAIVGLDVAANTVGTGDSALSLQRGALSGDAWDGPPPSYDDENLSPITPAAPYFPPPQLQRGQQQNNQLQTTLQQHQQYPFLNSNGITPSVFMQHTVGAGGSTGSGEWDTPKFAFCSTRRQDEFNQHYDSLYPFQKEVFCRAMHHSSIIFLPTGAGKTVIAAAMAAYKVALEPSKKIVFVVNRIPLVSQQANVIGRYGLRVAQVCGDRKDATSWSTFLADGFEALVIIDALLIEFIAKYTTTLFDDCSLIVFDEVHHARKSSNYSKLLQMMDKSARPMVIGLSASPSARENAAKTREALEDLMGVSHCQVVCVLKETADLKHRVAVPAAEAVLYQPSMIEKLVDELIKAGLRNFEESFVEKLKRLSPASAFPFVNCRGFPFGSPQYIDKTREATMAFQQSNSAACATVAEHIGALNQALILLEETSPREAARFLLTHPTLDDVFPSSFDSLVDRVRSRFPSDDVVVENELSILDFANESTAVTFTGLRELVPLLQGEEMSTKMKVMLSILEETVDEEYKIDQLESFRGIVFCETKAATVQIINTLKTSAERIGKALRPAYFVGHGRTLVPQLGGVSIGMTDNQQQRVLRAFREGDTKLLIATSVAEEGLDIPMCNVVIRYEGVFSVQSFIQSRGRARKRNSKFIAISKDVPANPLRDVMRDCRIQSAVVREVALSDQGAIIAANGKNGDEPLRICEADPLKFMMQVSEDYGVRYDQEVRPCRGGTETFITARLPDGTLLRAAGLGNQQRSAQEARVQLVRLLYNRGYIRNDTVVSSQALGASREMAKFCYYQNPNVALSNTRGALSGYSDGAGLHTQVTVYDDEHWGPYVKPLVILDKHLREKGFEAPRPVRLPSSSTTADAPDVITAAVEFQMRNTQGGQSHEIKWYSCSCKGSNWEAAMQGAAMEALRALGHNVVMRPHSVEGATIRTQESS
jgi:ERCC4-related helicase